MVIENSLLKEKIGGMQDRFRRIEEKRDSYIKDLSVKVEEAKVIIERAEDRKKVSAR